MEFHPPRRQGFLIGLALLGALLALDGVWLGLLRRLPFNALSLIWIALILASLPALAFVIASLYGLVRLAYSLDRHALTIRWGASSILIPLYEIERVLVERDVGPGASPRLHLRGLYWPGRLVGVGRAEGFGPAHFYATRPWPNQVLVVSQNSVYVLSPADPQAFAEALATARTLGPARQFSGTTDRPAFVNGLAEVFRSPLRDRVAQGLMGAGAALNLALFGYLAWRYPRLPATIPLHFDPAGVPDVLGPASQAFILPTIGLITFFLNSLLGWGLHARQDRSPAYLLWGATVLVQVLLWVAAFGL